MERERDRQRDRQRWGHRINTSAELLFAAANNAEWIRKGLVLSAGRWLCVNQRL